MTKRTPDPKWSKLIVEWKKIQEEMRGRMVVSPFKGVPRWVAGADAAYSSDKKTVFAVALVYDREEGRVVEVVHERQEVVAPYIPGYLSFREGPAVIDALRRLKTPWEVVCCDGQGYAHPRRCGFATHVGVTVDKPAIGVAKSRLIGTFEEPVEEMGSVSCLMDKGEVIGEVVRTKAGCKPVFVSVGHRVDLESARRVVMGCCTKYRVPEPTRLADIEVARLKGKGV